MNIFFFQGGESLPLATTACAFSATPSTGGTAPRNAPRALTTGNLEKLKFLEPLYIMF